VAVADGDHPATATTTSTATTFCGYRGITAMTRPWTPPANGVYAALLI